MTVQVRAAIADSSASTPASKWKLAVVFHRSKTGFVYQGVVLSPQSPHFPPPAQKIELKSFMCLSREDKAPAQTENPDADYQIWFVAPEAYKSIWYSSHTKKTGMLQPDGSFVNGIDDDGSVASIVKQCRRARYVKPSFVNPMMFMASYPNYPRFLSICADADIIVSGHVAGIASEETSLDAQGYTDSENTVVAFAVDEYIKPGGRFGFPVIKVYWGGGSLPYRMEHESGTGYVYANQPYIQVGQRYILFLTGNTDFLEYPHERPDIPYFLPVDPTDGVLLVKAGIVRPNPSPNRPKGQKWRFDEGYTPLGKKEQDVIQDIKDEVQKWNVMKAMP